MDLLYLFFAYNRKGILSKCLDTIFSKNELKPNHIIISDDGSNEETKKYLYDFQLNSKIPVDIISLGKTIDAGTCCEFAFNFVEYYSPKYLYIIETDYIFRKNGLDTVNWLFENNEYAQNGIGFSGYDGPDFYRSEKTERDYLDIIPHEFNEPDNLNRKIMYKPFEQVTPFGNIGLELVSNSCPTMYLNWSKLLEIKKEFPKEFELWLYRLFDRHQIPNKRVINDAAESSGIGWMWTKWAIKNNINIDKYAAILNVKPSVANHINGMGVSSGGLVGEMQTFVSSPTWDFKQNPI